MVDNTGYQGDMLKLLASGTEILATGTATAGFFTADNSGITAKLSVPMFYVVVTTTAAVTGNVVVTYQEKIVDYHLGSDKTVTVPMTLIATGKYAGVKDFTNDYSSVTLKSVTNGLSDNVTTFKVYLVGKIMY